MRSSKIIPRLIITVLVVILLFSGLDILLYPCTFMRNDIHNISTAQNDVLIFGTSTGKMNIDPDTLLYGTGYTGHNVCVGGESPEDAYFMLKLSLEKQGDSSVKQVIFVVDPEYFVTEKKPGDNFLLCFHEFPLSLSKAEYFFAELMDKDIRNPWFAFYEYSLEAELPRVGTNLKLKLSDDYSIEHLKGEIQEYHKNGWIEEYPVEVENFPAMKKMDFSSTDVKEKNIRYLDKLVSLCRDRNIEFVALSSPLPISALKNSADAYNRAWDYFGEYFENNNVTYYNFNRELLNTYSHEDSDFVDYSGHMDGEHALMFSEHLRGLLYSDISSDQTIE